jgi:Fe-S cluster biosynthesis and repair protein YggX
MCREEVNAYIDAICREAWANWEETDTVFQRKFKEWVKALVVIQKPPDDNK